MAIKRVYGDWPLKLVASIDIVNIHWVPPGKDLIPPGPLKIDPVHSDCAPGWAFAPAWTQIQWSFVYIQTELKFPNSTGYGAAWKLQLWLQGVLVYSEPLEQRNMNFLFFPTPLIPPRWAKGIQPVRGWLRLCSWGYSLKRRCWLLTKLLVG